MDIVAVAVAEVSACEVAMMVTRLSGLGAVAGAVYAPPLVMLPQVAPEQFAPDNVQVTAVLALPVTVAVNWTAVELPC